MTCCSRRSICTSAGRSSGRRRPREGNRPGVRLGHRQNNPLRPARRPGSRFAPGSRRCSGPAGGSGTRGSSKGCSGSPSAKAAARCRPSANDFCGKGRTGVGRRWRALIEEGQKSGEFRRGLDAGRRLLGSSPPASRSESILAAMAGGAGVEGLGGAGESGGPGRSGASDTCGGSRRRIRSRGGVGDADARLIDLSSAIRRCPRRSSRGAGDGRWRTHLGFCGRRGRAPASRLSLPSLPDPPFLTSRSAPGGNEQRIIAFPTTFRLKASAPFLYFIVSGTEERRPAQAARVLPRVHPSV